MEDITNSQEISNGTSGVDLLNAFDVAEVPSPEPSSTPEPTLLDDNFDLNRDNLPPEEAKERSFQSRFDKLQVEHQKIKEQFETSQKYVAFVEELMEDDELLDAFLYERKPELVSKKDIDSMIADRLKAEFGDYVPDPSEPRTPGISKAWRYEKFAEQVYNELRTKNSDKNLTVKELRARRAEMKKAQEMEFANQLNRIKKEQNWTDQEVRNFYDFTQKLDLNSYVKIYKFATKNARQISPSIAMTNGQAPSGQSPRERFLNDFK